MQIPSGDDDLFINQVATDTNTAICFSKDSFTTSKPKATFKDWYNQKRRHISTASHYKFKHKFMLGLFYFSQIFFWVLAIILLSLSFKPIIVISLFGFRLLVQYIIIGYSSKKLDESDTILLLPFLEIFLIVFQLSIFITNLLSKPTHWR